MDQLPIGRARTVLVFRSGEDEVAVISSVIARVFGNGKDRISFTGPVEFEESASKHITRDVLPFIDRIFSALGVPSRNFEISVVNLGTASVADLGMTISGFSADVPVLLAMMSAGLEMPVPENIVSTGHISSADGDIGLVESIPIKLDAAIGNEKIHIFIYPSIDEDGSLKKLWPSKKQDIEDAVTRAKREVKTVAVRDVGELLKAVFPDEVVILASLRQGFFKTQDLSMAIPDRIGIAVRFLAEKNEERFWTVLERHLFSGENDRAQELLLAMVQFHIQQQAYPTGIGRKLRGLLQSVPPATRRLKITFPLIPVGEGIRVSQFAEESDHEDVMEFFNAVNGQKLGQDSTTKIDEVSVSLTGSDALERVLSEIDELALAKKIGLPIDEARASFIMDSVIVKSDEEFDDVISAFTLHLLRHYRLESVSLNKESAATEAYELLEEAFSRKGGSHAAQVEGKTGTHGGMRFVLDVMTEQFKMKEQEKYINMVFKRAIDLRDRNEKVAFMTAFFGRIRNQLPPDIRDREPEEFVKNYEQIIRLYVNSLAKVKELLRAF